MTDREKIPETITGRIAGRVAGRVERQPGCFINIPRQ
jgi:hypothetical protein